MNNLPLKIDKKILKTKKKFFCRKLFLMLIERKSCPICESENIINQKSIFKKDKIIKFLEDYYKKNYLILFIMSMNIK